MISVIVVNPCNVTVIHQCYYPFKPKFSIHSKLAIVITLHSVVESKLIDIIYKIMYSMLLKNWVMYSVIYIPQ